MSAPAAHTTEAGPASNAAIRVTPITDAVGARVDGVDLTNITSEQVTAIASAFDTYGALLFSGQKMEATDLVRFSRHFGNLDEAPVNEDGKTAVPGHPEIYVVSNIKGADGKAVGSLGAGEAAWHTDMSYLASPPKASMLYAVEIPPTGGNTWLAGMASAYDTLPDGLRSAIAGVRIKHDGTYNSAGLLRQGVTATDDLMAAPGALHPAVIKHPSTGRRSLYLGRRRNAFVEGMSTVDSDALLDELWAHATASQHTYSHTWSVGDVLMWDNRMTLHKRDPFDADARRYMLRTQISGDAPPAA